MTNCESCPSKDKCSTEQKQSCDIQNNIYNEIKCVIAVMSGKGGVGKSTVSVLLARMLQEKGLKVGIMDADVTGPSIPRLLNVKKKPMIQSEIGIEPLVSDHGIKVMSLNFLLEDDDAPVIWRGPIISGVVKQFWSDVYWGELDVLLIDLPPGTGDVALTVLQSIPVNRVIMVSTPQDMVSMIVTKAIKMVQKMDKEVLGVIQNMAYTQCPHCQERIDIFSDQAAKDKLVKEGAPLLAELPLQVGLDTAGELEGPTVEAMDRAVQTVISIINTI